MNKKVRVLVSEQFFLYNLRCCNRVEFVGNVFFFKDDFIVCNCWQLPRRSSSDGEKASAKLMSLGGGGDYGRGDEMR